MADQQNEIENYPLDEATINFFAIWKTRRDDIQARMNGAFELFLHQHNLKGNWKLADNGKELERISAPQTQIPQARSHTNERSE